MKAAAQRATRWLAFAFLCLYALTAQRGVAWQDSGVRQLRVAYRDLFGTDGLACAHPLYISTTHALCRLLGDFVGLEVPTAANLVSALWMAVALLLFADCARRLSKSYSAAILATLTLGLAHLAWWLSTIAETYTMSLCLLVAEMRCAIRLMQGERAKSLYAGAAAFSGLGFAVHNLALLSLPVTAAALAFSALSGKPHYDGGANAGRRTGTLPFLWNAFRLLVVWMVCAWPVLGHAHANFVQGAPLSAVVNDLLFGHYGPQVAGRAGSSYALMLANYGIVALSLSSPCWAFGALALVRRIRAAGLLATARATRPEVRYAAILLFIHAAFALRYRIPDQALFFLPTLALAALLLSPPLAAFLENAPRHRAAILATATVVCAVAAPVAASAALHLPPIEGRILATRARILPFRDEIRYWALPWKHNERSAERFAAEAIKTMDATPGASLFADSTSAPPIMLRISNSRDNSWQFHSPWGDASRFTADCLSGRPCLAVSPVAGYCPADALATGMVRPLFPAK